MQHFPSNVVQHSDRAEESSSIVSALQLYRPLKEDKEILQKETKLITCILLQNLGNTRVMWQTQTSKPDFLTQEKQAAARKIPIIREKNPVTTAQ